MAVTPDFTWHTFGNPGTDLCWRATLAGEEQDPSVSFLSIEWESEALAVDDPGVGATAFALLPNAPNPFSGLTSIRYDLPHRTMADLRIYDAAGRLVRVLFRDTQDSGHHAVQWDGRNDLGEPVRTGIYWYRLEAGSRSQTRKLMFLR